MSSQMKTSTINSENSLWQKSQLSEIVVLLGLSVTVPFLIHLFPIWGALPLGAYLLPMFYAPLLAALFCRIHVGVVVCLFGPWLNMQLTGQPESTFAILLTAQLLVFYVLLKGLTFRGRSQRQWYFGPLSFLATKGLIMVLLLIFPTFLTRISPFEFFLNSTIYAFPGLVIISLIGWLAILTYPSESSAS